MLMPRAAESAEAPEIATTSAGIEASFPLRPEPEPFWTVSVKAGPPMPRAARLRLPAGEVEGDAAAEEGPAEPVPAELPAALPSSPAPPAPRRAIAPQDNAERVAFKLWNAGRKDEAIEFLERQIKLTKARTAPPLPARGRRPLYAAAATVALAAGIAGFAWTGAAGDVLEFARGLAGFNVSLTASADSANATDEPEALLAEAAPDAAPTHTASVETTAEAAPVAFAPVEDATRKAQPVPTTTAPLPSEVADEPPIEPTADDTAAAPPPEELDAAAAPPPEEPDGIAATPPEAMASAEDAPPLEDLPDETAEDATASIVTVLAQADEDELPPSGLAALRPAPAEGEAGLTRAPYELSAEIPTAAQQAQLPRPRPAAPEWANQPKPPVVAVKKKPPVARAKPAEPQIARAEPPPSDSWPRVIGGAPRIVGRVIDPPAPPENLPPTLQPEMEARPAPPFGGRPWPRVIGGAPYTAEPIAIEPPPPDSSGYIPAPPPYAEELTHISPQLAYRRALARRLAEQRRTGIRQPLVIDAWGY
jgi:hypothetical protein